MRDAWYAATLTLILMKYKHQIMLQRCSKNATALELCCYNCMHHCIHDIDITTRYQLIMQNQRFTTLWKVGVLCFRVPHIVAILQQLKFIKSEDGGLQKVPHSINI